jgi:nucleotide-binding universal stress UspA family protein
LLIIRGRDEDRWAIELAVRLARRKKAGITALVVIPDIPAFYNISSDIQMELSQILMLDTTPGLLIRDLIHRCENLGLNLSLKQYRGSPQDQIRRGLEKDNCDLIIISHEERGWLSRLWQGEIVRPLLRWVDKPVLVARLKSG